METGNDRFTIPSVKPALVSSIGPETDLIADCPDVVVRSAEQSAADRLLSLAVCVFSQWFVLMKSIMTRERVIARERYKERTGNKVWGDLPYSKEPCVRQPLTASDMASSVAYEAVVRSTFGDKAADFARERFLRAISTGDKRSFKIRFLFYKASDGLKGTALFGPFRKRLEDVVTEAEAAAGCTPDPSPRRMSLAEQERKRRKEMEPKQLDLFDYLPVCNSQIDNKKDDESENGQCKGDVCADNGRDSGCSDGSVLGAVAGAEHCAEGGATSDNVHSETYRKGKRRTSSRYRGRSNKDSSSPVDQDIVRKTRVYESCAELIADIKSGAVTPYQTSNEVVSDIKRGSITPSEAVIFLAELGKRNKRQMPVAWGELVMPSEQAVSEGEADDDSPSDEELDYIDEEECLDDRDDDDISLTSESVFFN